MNAHRVRTGLAIGLLGIALSTGTAAAQVDGCSYSDCTPQQPEETTTTTAAPPSTTIPEDELFAPEVPGDELGTGEEVGAPGQVAPPGVLGEELSTGETSAPSGSLPITGGDVIALTAIGAAALVGGTLLVKRSKQA